MTEGSGISTRFDLTGRVASDKMDNPATLISCDFAAAVSTLPGAEKSAAEGLRFPNAVTVLCFRSGKGSSATSRLPGAGLIAWARPG
ncbi:MAG: hypothetical protein KAI80_01045, partial [Hyphomicrobiaceae bacterium]|nr:hypothetical protein [Hyphomicrobiaceae bacterium]